MQARGYSLVEMVVVIAVISILLAIAILKFSEYANRYRAESQARLIYSELLKARSNAVYERRSSRVKLYTDHFDVYSSTQDDTNGVAPVRTQLLDFPVDCNGTGDGVKGYPLDFNGIGLASNSCSICVENYGSGAVDSMVISDTRLNIGIKDTGASCGSANITFR